MKVIVTVQTVNISKNEFSTLSINGAGRPLDAVFYGNWSEVNMKRNKRCEKWADTPGVTEVFGAPMPVPTNMRIR